MGKVFHEVLQFGHESIGVLRRVAFAAGPIIGNLLISLHITFPLALSETYPLMQY